MDLELERLNRPSIEFEKPPNAILRVFSPGKSGDWFMPVYSFLPESLPDDGYSPEVIDAAGYDKTCQTRYD